MPLASKDYGVQVQEDRSSGTVTWMVCCRYSPALKRFTAWGMCIAT